MIDEDIKFNLTSEQAVGITVNERLYLAGLIESFDKAIAEQNKKELKIILEKVYPSPKNIEAIS